MGSGSMKAWWFAALGLVACGPDGSTESTGGGGSGGTDASTTSTTSTSSTGSSVSQTSADPTMNRPPDRPSTTSGGSTTSPAMTSTSGFPPDECDIIFDSCGPGTACCGSPVDPYVCVRVGAGQCGGGVECDEGLECRIVTGCGVGDCVAPEPRTTGSSGSSSGTSSSTGSR